jgi:hypothetical protein
LIIAVKIKMAADFRGGTERVAPKILISRGVEADCPLRAAPDERPELSRTWSGRRLKTAEVLADL